MHYHNGQDWQGSTIIYIRYHFRVTVSMVLHQKSNLHRFSNSGIRHSFQITHQYSQNRQIGTSRKRSAVFLGRPTSRVKGPAGTIFITPLYNVCIHDIIFWPIFLYRQIYLGSIRPNSLKLYLPCFYVT